jgi:hypothetical protein
MPDCISSCIFPTYVPVNRVLHYLVAVEKFTNILSLPDSYNLVHRVYMYICGLYEYFIDWTPKVGRYMKV